MNHGACVGRHSQNESIIIYQLKMKNHSKILKLLQFEEFYHINLDF